MCGIAGFVQVSPGANPEIARRMTTVITHRGPDSGGHFDDAHVSMGMRRLSIVDLAGGHQPIPNEDSTRWIIYNGEVFNHAALRPDLERQGHRYHTHSDTETILHSFEQYGPACLEHFRGMFAFAIWEPAARTLFIARDRLGIKPLYYYWDGRSFVFGSEIKSLLEHPAVTAALDPSQLSEYLAFGFISSEQTLFRGIRQLMPGHYLWLRLKPDGTAQLDIQQYWDAPIGGGGAEPAPTRSDAEWIAECRERLEETVRMRLMADVPLGMFLSGGVDSSAIAALIRRMVPEPVKTFSVGYAEAAYSELGYAQQVATYLGTDHHETRVGMDQFFEALPKLIWHEDTPICWPSSVSLYFVSQLAAKHVKVVLTGEGSDELFGGYERYRAQIINQRWADRYGVVPGFLRDMIRGQLETNSLLPGGLRRKALHTFVGRTADMESLFLDNFYCAFSRAEQARLLRGEAGAPYASYRKYWDQVPAGTSLLERMLYADKKTYLVELLMKQDRMSMACSIESRVPFLDHHFVAFASQVPQHLKIHGATQKHILKEAVADLLPHEIIHRKKMGFPTPLRQWFASAAGEKLFAGLFAKNGLLAEHLDLTAVKELLDRHRAGREDATDRLWRLLNLQIWGEVFLEKKHS